MSYRGAIINKAAMNIGEHVSLLQVGTSSGYMPRSGLRSFLEGGTKYPWKELQRQSLEQRLKERPFRACPNWGSIPYTVTKPRHYCGCQQVLADRSLIELPLRGSAVSDKYRGKCTQPTIGLSTGSPMEELRKDTRS